MPKIYSAPLPKWATVLRLRRVELRLSQEEVAERTGHLIAQRTISHLETGRTHLTAFSYARVAALARALEWTLAEMQEGTGLDLGFPVELADVTRTDSVSVRHIGSVTTGQLIGRPSILSTSEFDGYTTLHRDYTTGFDPNQLYTLVVAEDSMASEEVRTRLEEGTRIVVHPSLDPDAGDIVSIWLEEHKQGALIEWWPQRKVTRLESWNREQPPIIFDENTPYKMQGVVVSYPVVLRRNRKGKRKS